MAGESKFGENVNKMIAELNLEFKEKMENYAGNMLIENKLFKIGNMIDFQFENFCGSIIERIKYLKKTNDKKEMDIAMKNLETCMKPFDNMMKENKVLQDVFYKIFQNQNINCYVDCHNAFGEKDEIKPCLKECLSNFDKFTLKAFGEVYSNYLDDVNENLMKSI